MRRKDLRKKCRDIWITLQQCVRAGVVFKGFSTRSIVVADANCNNFHTRLGVEFHTHTCMKLERSTRVTSGETRRNEWKTKKNYTRGDERIMGNGYTPGMRVNTIRTPPPPCCALRYARPGVTFKRPRTGSASFSPCPSVRPRAKRSPFAPSKRRRSGTTTFTR